MFGASWQRLAMLLQTSWLVQAMACGAEMVSGAATELPVAWGIGGQECTQHFRTVHRRLIRLGSICVHAAVKRLIWAQQAETCSVAK